MRYKAIFMVLLSVFCLQTGRREASALDLSARAAVLYDASTGRILYSKNADERLPIASTTKIMTGIVAIETMNFEQMLTVKREHMTEGSSMYLREGEKLSVGALVNGLLLVSGNDAASVLAAYGGTEGRSFVDLMNGKASELGLENTHFDNPHGLDSDRHYSTAADLAIIADYAMKNPVFAAIVSKKSDFIEGHSLRNHNKLLWRYEGADGVKTGFTKRAGRCLVSSAVRNDRRLIAVTIDAPSDWNDHKNLFDMGFDNYKMQSFVEKGELAALVPVISGEVSAAPVITNSDVKLWLTADETTRITKRIELPHFVYAPVRRLSHAGRLVFLLDGKEIGEASLIYDFSVRLEKNETAPAKNAFRSGACLAA